MPSEKQKKPINFMANTLATKFRFDDRDGGKVDDLRQKLFGLNSDINNLGGNTSFGKTIGLEADKGVAAVGKLGKEVEQLKAKTETFKPQPMISRHWENEALETKKSVDSINRSINSLKTPVGNPGSDSVKRIADFGKDSPTNLLAGPALDITGKIERELGVIEKKSNDVRKSFSSIAATRLDAGQASHLTKEIVRASDRSRQLSTDIVNIRRELANPNRKSSIAFLTDELRGAQTEADRLNRRLSILAAPPAAGSGSASRGASGQSGRLSSFQKTNLFYQANDVATMAAMGANPMQILASQGGQIAQIFSPAQATALVSAYAGLATVATAGAVAIGLTYKITGDIRAEAERRLKTEEMITAAINKQRIAQRDAFNDLQKARLEAENNRSFSRDLQTGSVDELKARRENLEKLAKLVPAALPVIEDGKVVSKPNESFQKIREQLLALDAQIDATGQNKVKQANDAFGQRFESFKKSQESSIEAQQRQIALQQKHAEEIEKAKEKVKELGKTYRDVADGLLQRANANNPFVSLFSEADKSLQTLRRNTKGLSADLIATFEQMEAKANSLKLFETRIDNNLQAFDLRERAKELRGGNQSPLKIDDPNKFFEDYIEFYSKKLEADSLRRTPRYAREDRFGGVVRVDQNPFTRFNRVSDTGGGFGGFSQSDARNDLLYSFDRVSGGLGGFSRRRRTFADLTEAEKRSFIEQSTKSEVNLSLNDRLERQRSIIYDGAFTEDQKALADRKFLALTSNVDSNELSGRNREELARVAERQAARLERAETDARADRAKDAAIKERIANDLTKIREIAEKDGLKGIENLVRIVDETSGGVALPAAPTAADPQKAYNDAYKGGTFFDEANK